MKPIRHLLIALTALAGLAFSEGAPAATTYTDGTASFTVNLVSIPGNYSQRVDAYWVTDGAGRFVQTVRRDAGTRRNYLAKWIAARGSWPYDQVDGFSGATINTWGTFTVNWDCRDTNNVLMPDGEYRFWVEMTDQNGQGPYTTNGIPFYKGQTNVNNTYPNQQYIQNISITYTSIITHDLALTSLTPRVAYPNTTVPVRVTLTNLTSFTEAFTLTLSNLTTASLLGAQTVPAFAGNTSTTLTFDWDTIGVGTGDYVLQAYSEPVPDERSTTDNTLTATLTIRDPLHDVGVLRISAPSLLVTNTTANVVVTVTNAGDFTESFEVTLTDATIPRPLGSGTVTSLAAFAARDVNLTWRGTNVELGYHTLQAVALPVTDETILSNNTNSIQALVALGSETNILIAKGSFWRYHDRGLDLSATPWKERSFYDGTWSLGLAPLGYGDTWIRTNLYYGTNSSAKYPTYYFRNKFYLDAPPASLAVRVMRDDGVVVYVNGVEAFRHNMPADPVGYGTFASSAVGSTDETNYFLVTLGPTNVVMGENCLAVELHQSDPGSSDLGFDLELSVISPKIPRVRAVPVAQVSTPGDALAGDRVPLTITLTNQGNVTETFFVYVRDLLTGQIIGSNGVANLVPGGSTVAKIDWKTLGAAAGSHMLQAFTVVNGVTNLAGAGTAAVTIGGSGLSLDAVNAAGAIGGRCAALTTTSNLLIVGAGAALEVWDRSVPEAPVRVGAVRLPGLVEGIAVSGVWAYAACGSAGVQFVDLSTPTHPLHRNTFNSSGHAYAVAISGNYLYVADGVAGLRVLNISNPLAPSLAGVYYTDGPARAVSTASTRAYVLDAHKGLVILNIASPTAPALLGTYAGFSAGQAIVASTIVAYVIDANNRFYVLNVLTPTAPSLLSSILLTNKVGRAIASSGTTVYVAAGDGGLLTINAASPTLPVLASTIPTSSQAGALAVAGSTLYVANGFAGCQIFDISTSTSPALRAELPAALRAADVVVAGGLAYVAAGESGLRIFSITNSAAPVLLSRFTEAVNASSVAVSGSVAYVGDGQYGLKIIEISNPTAPALLGTYASADLGYIRNVGVSGSYVVVSDGRRICLLNASTPAAPTLVNSYDAPAFAFALTVAGGRAYLACGDAGLIILDAGAGGLSLAGSYDTPGQATCVSVLGTSAYVADGPSGWLILDVSNPAAPSLINASAAQGPVFGVAASGALATLGGANTAVTMDVTVPLTPVARNTFGPLVRAMRLSAEGLLAVTAEDEAGLAILSNSSDVDQDGLPDAWEAQIVNASLATNGPIRAIWDVLPGADFDSDGASNYGEYVGGTSPTDAASRFAAFVPPANGGGPVTVTWTTVPGKTYTVHRSSDLAAGFTVVADNLPATQTSYTDNNPPNPAFYIISVR
jgi:hypothetical protein